MEPWWAGQPLVRGVIGWISTAAKGDVMACWSVSRLHAITIEEAYEAAVSEGWPVSETIGGRPVAGMPADASSGTLDVGVALSAEPGMSLEWHRDDVAGDVWSSLVEDGQHGWFEVQLERDPAGWQWVITHEHASWGCASHLEDAKAAVASQLGRVQARLPPCEIRPFAENARGGYLILFPSFPGIVASGASPEEAIRRGRDALAAVFQLAAAGGGKALGRGTGTPRSE